jgi:hypothetical protein
MGFTLPDEMPTDAAGLAELRTDAGAAFDELRAIVEAGDDLTDEQMTELRDVAAAIETIETAQAEVAEAEEARRTEAAELIARVGGTEETAEAETEETAEAETEEATAEAEADVVAEAEAVAAEAAAPVAASAARPVKFTGNRKAPAVPAAKPEVGFRMDPNAPGFKAGLVGFKELAQAIDSVRPGPGNRRRGSSKPDRGSFAAATIARLDRDMTEVNDSHELVAAINKATNEANLPGGSLTAAGGWCAPSEQLYDFCAVPTATDLISLPEIAIRRGGVRWPVEPDLSAIFNSFQFFFTEPELEAVDVDGNPTAIKECVEVPCPDEFEELRLNAVGYCVEAGILQTQGWPELIEWFMQSLAQEHLRAMSRRTINDMVAGSGAAKVIPAGSQIGVGSSVLNSLALQALNLRLAKGLGRTATIEGVAPSWLFEVIRADLANQSGVESYAVSDAQITSWLSTRNIALQFVGDWQTRGAGQPGNMATLVYPGTVDVLLYPAGTWFRSLSNVIEFGVMYPKEQLQVNRYTRFFTEDAVAVGKRCNDSILVRVPICPSGAIGERQFVTCNTPTP